MTADVSIRRTLSLKSPPPHLLADIGFDGMTEVRSNKNTRRSFEPANRNAWNVAILDAMVAEWPGVFFPKGIAPLPLAIGIHAQIIRDGEDLRQRLGMSKREFRNGAWVSLRHYVGAKRYQQALACGGFRIGLSGQPQEQVSAEHRADALTRLNDMLLAVKNKAKRKTSRKPSEVRSSFRRGEMIEGSSLP